MSEGSKKPAPAKVVAIVQARLGSVRFPKKVLKKVNGKPLIQLMLERLKSSKMISETVLAIPDSKDNDELETLGQNIGVAVFRGSELDVLNRFAEAAKVHDADIVIRLTGDCPLIDPAIVDECVEKVLNESTRHSITSQEFPDGLDVEVFRAELLYEAQETATAPHDREHVTPYIQRTWAGETIAISPGFEAQEIRITLDEPEDFRVIEAVFQHFDGQFFSGSDISNLAKLDPSLFEANRHLVRDEGSNLDTGQKMWKRATAVIAGGNHLLSKNPAMHSPTNWPTYFSRAKGCSVWDLDGREFLDFGFMGIGTNILGYGFEPVDEAVRKVISDGNLSTLNAPEEVLLAEKLCELHPWADMARFTRSGGEAGAVAVRIARAATGKDKVLFCGYHGWHDWYLAANLADDEALDDHLLPGLPSAGVPRGLLGTAVPFSYNDLSSLEKAARDGGVAAIYMEVERSTPPEPGFLEGVRAFATKIGAVLVFDECTSGFRKTLGGIHLCHGVEPDVAVFGKTLGNGYAINAVIGRREVMEATRHTFISSTFWTERIGLAAALETLRQMEIEEAPKRIDALGARFRTLWGEQANEFGLDVSFSGLPALTSLSVDGLSPALLKTCLATLFLERGYLAGGSFYASIAHGDSMEDRYGDSLGEVLKVILEAFQQERIEDLAGPELARTGFGRLA